MQIKAINGYTSGNNMQNKISFKAVEVDRMIPWQRMLQQPKIRTKIAPRIGERIQALKTARFDLLEITEYEKAEPKLKKALDIIFAKLGKEKVEDFPIKMSSYSDWAPYGDHILFEADMDDRYYSLFDYIWTYNFRENNPQKWMINEFDKKDGIQYGMKLVYANGSEKYCYPLPTADYLKNSLKQCIDEITEAIIKRMDEKQATESQHKAKLENFLALEEASLSADTNFNNAIRALLRTIYD